MCTSTAVVCSSTANNSRTTAPIDDANSNTGSKMVAESSLVNSFTDNATGHENCAAVIDHNGEASPSLNHCAESISDTNSSRGTGNSNKSSSKNNNDKNNENNSTMSATAVAISHNQHHSHLYNWQANMTTVKER